MSPEEGAVIDAAIALVTEDDGDLGDWIAPLKRKVDALLAIRASQFVAAPVLSAQTVTDGVCRNCGKSIVFKPYFFDGRSPNPSVWFHSPGSRTCAIAPEDPDDDWPIAEPRLIRLESEG